VRILEGFEKPPRCLAYSPDGKLLAAGDEGQTTLWSLPSGEQASTLPVQESTEALAFSPDGTLLALGLPGDVVIWEGLTEPRERVRAEGHKAGVRGLAWSPDGRLLVSAGWDSALRFWTTDLAAVADPLPALAPVTCLAFVAEGKGLAGGTSHGGLHFWEPAQRSKWKEAAARQTAQPVFSLAVTPGGELLATGHADGAIMLWDARPREQVAALAGHEWVVYGLGFTPDGSRLVSGSADGTVRLWDVPGRRLAATYRWHDSWINCVAVSPDGMTAASGGDDGKVVLWDLADI
jgi:WD40 repeat protein